MVQRLPIHSSAQAARYFFALLQESLDQSAKPAHADHSISVQPFWPDALLENHAVRRLQVSLHAARHRCARLEDELLQARFALDRMCSDLDRTKAGERRAHHLATHDDLTSLPNRLLFLDRLAHAIDGGTRKPLPMALLYLDLDGFKGINDTHGHPVGDEVLKVVSHRMRAALRHGDLISRLGGDEFACLLNPSPALQQLCILAGKLCAEIAHPIHCNGLELQVQASMGIVVADAWPASAEQMIADADRAMYRAKRTRSRYRFSGDDMPQGA
jgi:diguanylate cyclase (GGDEF)-like protein